MEANILFLGNTIRNHEEGSTINSHLKTYLHLPVVSFKSALLTDVRNFKSSSFLCVYVVGFFFGVGILAYRGQN